MTRDLFWFAAGVLATLAGCIVALPLLRRDAALPASWRSRAAGFAALAVIVALCVPLYFWLGTPSALDGAGATATPAPPAAGAADAAAPSMEAATEKLAARLAAGGGTSAEWELLARSYEFLGRGAEAAAARTQAGSTSPAPGTPVDARTAVGAADPSELDRAAALRGQRDFKGAAAIYAALAARNAMTASAWADYADTAASLADGRLSGTPAQYVARALALDPREPKALWLRASLAYQEKRYADAVADWQALRDALPADSPDQRIVAANLEESARLAGVPAPAAKAGSAARVEGTVEIAPALRERAGPGAALFIYAKEPGAAGPPLAVVRLQADRWPVSFRLDDSNAMVPGRNLSGAARVSVEARVSASGNALPASGDLVGSLADVDPKSGAAVSLRIDRAL